MEHVSRVVAISHPMLLEARDASCPFAHSIPGPMEVVIVRFKDAVFLRDHEGPLKWQIICKQIYALTFTVRKKQLAVREAE